MRLLGARRRGGRGQVSSSAPRRGWLGSGGSSRCPQGAAWAGECRESCAGRHLAARRSPSAGRAVPGGTSPPGGPGRGARARAVRVQVGLSSVSACAFSGQDVWGGSRKERCSAEARPRLDGAETLRTLLSCRCFPPLLLKSNRKGAPWAVGSHRGLSACTH